MNPRCLSELKTTSVLISKVAELWKTHRRQFHLLMITPVAENCSYFFRRTCYDRIANRQAFKKHSSRHTRHYFIYQFFVSLWYMHTSRCSVSFCVCVFFRVSKWRIAGDSAKQYVRLMYSVHRISLGNEIRSVERVNFNDPTINFPFFTRSIRAK